jgi:hypothetical protein
MEPIFFRFDGKSFQFFPLDKFGNINKSKSIYKSINGSINRSIQNKIIDETKTCPKYTRENLFDEREKDNYPEEVQDIIDLITFQEDILPVGSAKFKAHRYPSDIDIFEQIEGCCTPNEVRFKVGNQLQDIAKEINPPIFLGDFKAGSDTRYSIYIGEEIGGKIFDYEPQYIRDLIHNLFEQILLTKDERDELLDLVLNDPTIPEFIALDEKLRSYTIVRWTREDILNGYKYLRGNKKLFLIDALTDNSVVKIDLWAPLPYTDIIEPCLSEFAEIWNPDNDLSVFNFPQKYVEVTNWILISQKDFEGQKHTLTKELGNYQKSVRKDIYKYLNKDYLKASKRLWSLLRFELNEDLNACRLKDPMAKIKSKMECPHDEKIKIIETTMLKLTPLFASYIALLNSVKSDLEVIMTMMDKLPEDTINPMFYLQTVLGSILRLKCPSSECYLDEDVNEKIINHLTNLFEQFDLNSPLSLDDRKLLREEIESIHDEIKYEVNVLTLNYLKDSNIDISKILEKIV